MSETLSLRVVLQDTYDSTPATDKERNDLSLVAGSLLIIAWVRVTRGAVRLEERLAIYEPPTTRLVRARAAAPARAGVRRDSI